MTTQKTYTFDSLTITKTRIEDKNSVLKFITVERDCGGYFETIPESDPDHKKAIILMLNEENK